MQEKLSYTSPEVLDHQRIIFETVISSNPLPPKDNSNREPGNELVVPPMEDTSEPNSLVPSPTILDNIQSSVRTLSSFFKDTTTEPKYIPDSEAELPIEHQPPSTRNTTPQNPNQKFHYSSDISHPQVSESIFLPVTTVDSLVVKQEESTIVPIAEYPTSSSLLALQSLEPVHYNLPNASTSSNFSSMEGLIIAGASGLTLWMHRRRKQKNEDTD